MYLVQEKIKFHTKYSVSISRHLIVQELCDNRIDTMTVTSATNSDF